MKRGAPFSMTEYLPPAMKSRPPNTHTAGAPRGDHGADSSCHTAPSAVATRAGANVEFRFAAMSQSWSSKTIGDPPHADPARSGLLIQWAPSAEDHTSRCEFGLISR